MPVPKFNVGDIEPTALQFGLFSVAQPTMGGNDGHWAAGVEWETEACGVNANIAAGLCNPEDKEVDDPGNMAISFDPVTFYVLRECRGVADYNKSADRAVKRLTSVEGIAAERHLWSLLMNDANLVDLTPTAGTAVPVEVGVGLLEDGMARTYGGQPMLHGNRLVATLAAADARVRRHGNRLETELGSPFAAGGGYGLVGPADAAVADGTAWLVASGAVRIWRGIMTTEGPHFRQTPLDNTHTSLAERTYVIGYECAPQAVLVEVG